jgi:hypothetical protein
MTALAKIRRPDVPEPAVDYIPRQSGRYTITPEMAVLWLAHVHNIRALSQATIEAYARDMKNGHWPESGETIKWDVNDVCFDGEHRLRACILAQVPFESWVIVGLPVSASKTVDQGLKRQLAQILRGTGERYGAQLASTATLLWRWEQGREALIDAHIKPTIYDLTDVLEREPNLRGSVELTHGSYTKACRLSRSSTVPAFIHFMGFRTQGNKATRFLEQVSSGKNIGSGDPAYTLRERLIKLGRTQNRFNQRDTLALWVPAWNAFAEDRYLRRYQPMDYDNPDDMVLL